MQMIEKMKIFADYKKIASVIVFLLVLFSCVSCAVSPVSGDMTAPETQENVNSAESDSMHGGEPDTSDAAQNRTPDIGVGFWGDSRETVEALAGHGEWAYVRTASSYAGYDTILEYFFNDGGLYAGQHRIASTAPREEKYANVKTFLTSLYGEPTKEVFSTGDQKLMLDSFEEVLDHNGRAESHWQLPEGIGTRSSFITLSMLPDGNVTIVIYTM